MSKIYLGVHKDIKVHGRWIQTYTTDSGWYTTRAGGLWRALSLRKKNYSYENCVISFKDFTDFCDWCQEQEDYNFLDDSGKHYHLDKDILGDSVSYGKEVCCFILE